jgi:hypothetical protein
MKVGEVVGSCSMHGEMRNANKVSVRKSEGRDLLGIRRVKRIILKVILKKECLSMLTGFIWLTMDQLLVLLKTVIKLRVS